MRETFRFDYYYGIETEQFSFYRVPKILIKDRRFKNLSNDAKLLYGLMLDRMSLSMKNGWLDTENKVYIYYTMENIMDDLSCAKATAVKVLAELDSKKGIGLVEKKRQGLGRPDIIYVKNFGTVESTESPKKEKSDKLEENVSNNSSDIKIDKSDSVVAKASDYGKLNKLDVEKASRYRKTDNSDRDVQNKRNCQKIDELDKSVLTEVETVELQRFKNGNAKNLEVKLSEVQNLDFKKLERQNCRSSKVELQKVKELNANYTDDNYTNKNYTEMSYNNPIYQSDKIADGCDGLDESCTYISLIKENIDYENLMQDKKWNDKELYEELFQIICEIVCVKRKSVRVAGENYPYEIVKSKFLKLNSSHLMYVMDCMRKTVSKIGNIKAYIITALYNAGNTISHYYQQAVQHDMYGGGWQEIGIV